MRTSFELEDRCGFEAGDWNKRRYVRNNPANARDPEGTQEQAVPDVIPAFSDGELWKTDDVKGDMGGKVIIRKNVTMSIRDRKTNRLVLEFPDKGVSIQYVGKNSDDVDFVQFVWFRIRLSVVEESIISGKKAALPNSAEEAFRLPATSHPDYLKPIVVPPKLDKDKKVIRPGFTATPTSGDAQGGINYRLDSGASSPAYLASGGDGARVKGQSVLMFDNPLAAIGYTMDVVKAAPDPDMFQVDTDLFFDTYLVNTKTQRAFYHVRWLSQASWTKWGGVSKDPKLSLISSGQILAEDPQEARFKVYPVARSTTPDKFKQQLKVLNAQFPNQNILKEYAP